MRIGIRRRERSKNFVIGKPNPSTKFGIKSPHVLDLREFVIPENPLPRRSPGGGIKLRRRKSSSKKTEQNFIPEGFVFDSPRGKEREEFDDALLQENVLRELAGIESRDVELAASLIRQNQQVRGEFEQKRDFRPNLIPIAASDESSVSLTRGLLNDDLAIENNNLVSRFLQNNRAAQKDKDEARFRQGELQIDDIKEESIAFYFRKSRIFIIIAAATAGFLFGGFFVNRGIALKEESLHKGVLAYKNFASAKDALKDFNFKDANKNFAQAYEGLVSAEEALNKIGGATLAIVKNLPFESRADSSIALLTAAKHTAKAGEILSSAFAFLPLENAVSAGAFLKVLDGGDAGSQAGYLINTFAAFAEKLTYAEAELLSAEQAMQKVRRDDFPEGFRSQIAEMNERIPALLGLIKIAKDYSAISSLLLGKDGPKRYLVLLQNSSELRPTGGFIGTYALVEFENGGLKNMAVEGIYDADGQLVVNVIPPKPFQHIATGWSTHDANWFLDFPASAQKAAWFFERTGNGKVDGVIALNIEVIERLLELTGAIEIKEYGLSLSQSNFRDEIQYEVEAAYDKKLNKPKKILADFTPLFLERLLAISKEKNKEIVSSLINALEEKYIMLYSTDERVQEFLAGQEWAGTVNCQLPIANCQSSDYLAVVHSNIGGYKTDKYIENSVDYDIAIKDDGSALGNLAIRKKHNGGKSKYWWYNRKNIDYVKVYVPKGAEIASSSGGLRRMPEAMDYKALGFTEDKDIALMEKSAKTFGPIDIFEESGKTVFGAWIVTNAGDSSELKISYRLPFKTEFKNNTGKFNLYWQKQPGTRVSANFSMSIPKSWAVAWDTSEARNLQQSFALDKDKVIGYIFSK